MNFEDLRKAFAAIAPAIRQGQHELREEQIGCVLHEIVAVRKKYGNFMTNVETVLYAPRCDDCYGTLVRWQLEEPRWPDISASNWKKDLREYGASSEEIRRIAEGDYELPVLCHQCDKEISYGYDDVYVDSLSLEVYYPFLSYNEKSLSKQMKRALLDAYDRKCAGCNKVLTRRQATFDHIVPRSANGPAALSNIQPLCRGCQKIKGNQIPRTVFIAYHFPLIPDGSAFDA